MGVINFDAFTKMCFESLFINKKMILRSFLHIFHIHGFGNLTFPEIMPPQATPETSLFAVSNKFKHINFEQVFWLPIADLVGHCPEGPVTTIVAR